MALLRKREVKVMSDEELKEKLSELKEELMMLRSEAKASRPSNPGRIKEIKRAIARILTELNMRGVVE